jgi:hypothetical protein
MRMAVLTGATMSPWTATASVPVAVLTSVTAAAAPAQQTDSRLTRALIALNAAIDSQRQGRYEQADILFREAQAHQEDLTAEERQDLADRMKANGVALQARREGDEQLKKAEIAYKAGKTGEAEDLLKKVMANTSVTPDNRRKAAQLAGEIRPRGTDDSSVAGNSLPLARARVQQARAMVNRFDLDGAEQLAMEAKKLGATFTMAEDTPDKVLNDVGRLRSDPKALLVAARTSCERGDYDHAEQYAHMAEQKGSAWTMNFRGDSPSKVLKDAQAARARMAQNGQKPVVAQTQKPAETTAKVGEPVVTPPRMDTSKPAAPTIALAGEKAPSAPKTEQKPATALAVKEDAATLMQKSKDALAAGNLDEAYKLACRAKAAQTPQTGWGASRQLFEDTPDKLINEIHKVKHQRDQEESWIVLAEGRNLLKAGDLEGANKCAYRAETLHGPYSIMELGDRPHKLQADVQAALEKRRKAGLASLTGTKQPGRTQVATTTTPAVIPGSSLTNDKPGGTTGSVGPAIKSPSGATTIAGSVTNPGTVVTPPSVTTTPPPSALATSAPPSTRVETPPTVTITAPPPERVVTPTTTTAMAPPAELEVTPPTAEPEADVNKVKALALMVEARRLQKEGRLIEARRKALECVRLGVVLNLNEDRPEQALVQLCALAGKKMDNLVAEADNSMSGAGNNLDRLNKAEGNLVQAREIAVGFGLDPFRIDAKLGQVRQSLAQAKSPSTPPPIITTGYRQGPAGVATATDTACPAAEPSGRRCRQGWSTGGAQCIEGNLLTEEPGATWYWMRSPEHEKAVVMGLFNKYCIRCHGVDGRGIWDIPGIPDFTNSRWQASRTDSQLARIIIEGRGAVMPTFRGAISLEEAWAIGRYLRTFEPGTEVSRPDFKQKSKNATPAAQPKATPGGGGGASLSLPGAVHAFSDDRTRGDYCATGRPSILEWTKGVFHRNSCPNGSCTPDNGPYPVEVAGGRKIAPTPPRAPDRLLTELFQHSKQVDGADLSSSNEGPKADTQKPDPLQNPAAYSPSRATAELAGVVGAPAAPKGDTPLNAFTGPKKPLSPSTPISAKGGTSIGPDPYAAGIVAAAFHPGSPAMATAGPPTKPMVHLINKKSLTLVYEVKDVGPSGISGVELWYTRDAKDWRRHESAPDTKPPYLIEVQEEGLYGFTLLAKNGIGLSKEPPRRGDQPQVWVEVDLTKPTVALTDVKPEVRDKGPMLNIQWEAGDKNMASRPITISYAEKADGPWQPMGSNMDNSGRYQWPLRSGSPATMYIRVEAKDSAGNVGIAQTPMPIHVDMTRPTVEIVDVKP